MSAQLIRDESAQKVLAAYPQSAQKCLSDVRGLLLSAAQQHAITRIEECLKWGEPSYTTKGASPVRMA